MKKVSCIFVIMAMCFSPLCSKEKNYKARAAAGSSSDAAAISMCAWSVGLAAGIAVIFLLLKSSEGDTDPSH